MNVLVTGNRGFIGGHLSRALTESGNYVIGMDKRDVTGVDLSDWFYVRKFLDELPEKPEFIFHIAGSCSTQRGIDNPVEDFRDNALATIHVLEIAQRFNIPLVYMSTCKVQPNHEGIRTPYGLSKFVGEEYIREYAKCYGLEYVINRCGTIYGPGQEGSPESGWLAWFLKCKLENKEVTINGDGTNVRDVLYVTDLVQLLMDQMDNFDQYKNETYDVGGGHENAISVWRAIEVLHLKHTFGPKRLGDVKRFVSDNEKVMEVNNWRPRTKWEDGLNLTLSHYKNI